MPNLSYRVAIEMDAVTVSLKFQVVIPQAIREELHLKPGEKLRVMCFDDRVEVHTCSFKSFHAWLSKGDRHPY